MALNVHSFGDADGRPVVALHGVRGHGARWRRLAERHTTGLHVLGLDLRGHGRSPWTPPWTLEQHAADVLETMDDQGLEAVDLVGHSFGATVAIVVADQARDRIRRLVLLDPGIALDPGYVLGRVQQELVPASFPDAAAAGLERASQWPGLTDATVVDEEILDHLDRDEDGLWRWRYNAAAVVTAFSEMTRPAPVPPPGLPTLLVVATKGSAVGPRFLAAIEDTPDLDVTVVGVDSGHTVYVDRPEETGALVQDFLSR